jgi:acyl-ACP thioesterase
VRLGDVTPSGRLRLDSLTRYTQDVSDDDTADAGLAAEPAWVVRRTQVDVVRSATLGEEIVITTFCSGLGRRWAERRLSVAGSRGGRYEVATLWICVDPATGRPTELTDEFLGIYGEVAAGRRVTARLANPKPPAGATVRRWPLRAVDFDTLGHVNNAAYWAVVEEALAAQPEPEPFGVCIEYGAGLDLAAHVSIAQAEAGAARLLWWLSGTSGGTAPPAAVAASARLVPLPADLYRCSGGALGAGPG